VSFFSRIFGQKAVAQPEVLIFVQRDIGAPLGDRDDAAKDLAEFDEALPVLVETALRPGEDETLVDSCGESIAEIWHHCRVFPGKGLQVTTRKTLASNTTLRPWSFS
jgi:hypothetical protein